MASPRAATAVLARICGHQRHVGSCPNCQRRQLARWNAQLAQVSVTLRRAA